MLNDLYVPFCYSGNIHYIRCIKPCSLQELLLEDCMYMKELIHETRILGKETLTPVIYAN